jgi:hypothetical protein
VLFQRVLRIPPFAQNGVGVGRDVEVRLTADRESAGVSVWELVSLAISTPNQLIQSIMTATVFLPCQQADRLYQTSCVRAELPAADLFSLHGIA